MAFRLLVTGSKNLMDFDKLEKNINSFLSDKKKPYELMFGSLSGTDRLAEIFAKKYDLKFKKVKLETEESINKTLNKCDGCLIFWNTKSTECGKIYDLAKKKNLIVKMVMIQ